MIFEGASGGGGGSSTFKQTPDGLRSQDSLEGVLGLCVGPIVGPVNGLKSITLDGTPVEDASGTLNFQDFVVITADGHPAKHPQKVTLQLGAGGSPVSVNLAVGNTNPSGTPGPWVTKTVTSTGADFIDLRFIVNQLYRQDAKGIYGETANIELEMKKVGTSTWVAPQLGVPSTTYSPTGVPITGDLVAYLPYENFTGGGSWVPETNNGYITITGKTTSPYVYELRVAVPTTGAYTNVGWDVRVRLREPADVDADPNFEKRVIQWESVSAVYAGEMGDYEEWRGLAWVQIVGKASNQLSGIPEVAGVYDTKVVQVPPSGVYNPSARTYTATTWDGSWTSAFTTDPAWIINDAISDSLSGVSLIAPGSYLNKWDALEASKWFSEAVSDGDSGYHPRYNLNVVVDQQQKAEEFVKYLAGAVGGFAWDDGNGEWRMKVDKPENPVDVFTLENIAGEFIYSHTDIDARYNDIKLTYLNEEMDYRQDYVHLYDSTAIATYGRKPTTIVGIGCTNRQEALRRGKLRLRTSVNETRMVSFTTNRRGRMLSVFNTILVADSDLGTVTTGRVVTVDGPRTTITVRDPIRLEVGVAYQIRFTVPNPDYSPATTTQPSTADWRSPTITQTIAVTNTSGQVGDVTTLYLGSALPANVAEFLTIALEATSLPTLPKLYRILDLKPDDNGEMIAVTAIEVDTGKWAASDAVSPSDSILSLPAGLVPPPTAPTTGGPLVLIDIPNHYSLTFNWTRPNYEFLAGFQVKYRVNGGPWVLLAPKTEDVFYELISPVTGFYEFQVRSVDITGRLSQPYEASLDLNGYDLILDDQINALLDDLAKIAADNKLTPNEKPRVVQDRDVILAEQAGLEAQADAAGVTTEKTAYTNAISALTTYLATLTTPTLWSDFGGDTDIVGATFRTKFVDVYTARQVLINKLIATGTITLSAYATTQIITYDAAGAPAPTTQTNTFTAVKQGTIATVNWTLKDALGNVLTPATYLSATSGASVQMTEPNFAAAIAVNGANGVIVTATVVDGSTTVIENISVYKLQEGSNALIAFLTNSDVSLPASSAGVVSSFATAIGNVKVYLGTTDVTTSSTFAEVSETNCTGTINTGTGAYSVTALSADSGSYNVSATFDGTTIPLAFTLSKAKAGTAGANGAPGADGADGTNGTRTAILYMYRWSATTPTTWPSGAVTYTWATAQFTNPGTLNSWSRTIPAHPGGTAKLYRIQHVFTDTDTSATDSVTWTGSYTPEEYTPTFGDLAGQNLVTTAYFADNSAAALSVTTLGSNTPGTGSNVTIMSVTVTPFNADSVFLIIAGHSEVNNHTSSYRYSAINITNSTDAGGLNFIPPIGFVSGAVVGTASGLTSSTTFDFQFNGDTDVTLYAGATLAVLEIKKAA